MRRPSDMPVTAVSLNRFALGIARHAPQDVLKNLKALRASFNVAPTQGSLGELHPKPPVTSR